jgi:hypothetical protein
MGYNGSGRAPYVHNTSQQSLHPSERSQPTSSWVDSLSATTYQSPNVSRLSVENMRHSAGSSVYSIPDFPIIPQQVAPLAYQTTRRPPLGPPPSARRGPASYYPQTNHVTPIVEETDSARAGRDSKSSYASSNAICIGISRHLANQHDMHQDDESPFGDQHEHFRPTQKSNPMLTTIETGNIRPDSQTRPSPREGLDGFSEKSQYHVTEEHIPIYGHSDEQQTTLGNRVGSRRPGRIDVDAVRDAEARGSLTSLNDLIRRATKVASNLDRGRTASRLVFNFSADGLPSPRHSPTRHSNSLSDILAAFPPPGLVTTPGSRGSEEGSRAARAKPWASNLRHDSLPSQSDLGEDTKPKGRCCSMPLWLFLLILLLVVILGAAAVLLPVVLVVIPKQNETQRSASASALAACQSSLSCKNSGVNIVGSDGSCSCLCVSGFAGPQCTESSSTSCATTSIGRVGNVTLGDSIQRLLLDSKTNFSIPLDATIILDLFASSKLSCASENALVTFNGLSARSVEVDVSGLDTPASIKVLKGRATSTTSAGATVTSNGIVYSTGSPSDTPSPGTSSTGSSSDPSSNSTVLDFARIAVLFVLQESGQLSNAITAQENLQSYFTSGTTSTGGQINATNIDLGASFKADVKKYSITLSNGTVVGR